MEEKIVEGFIKGEEPPKLLENTNLKYMKDYLCKISGKILGTGFFCKIKYEDELIPVLMTNYHVLDDNYIKEHKQINIYMNNNKKIIKIYSDSLIYSSDINKYDITIIKSSNDYEINNYLEIEENIFKDNAEDIFKNESIYILYFSKGRDALISYGYGIEKINKYEIMHKCNIDSGSSGGPILNKLNNKIIGIHRGYFNRSNYNSGTLLKYPLNELSSKNGPKYEVSSNNQKNGIVLKVCDIRPTIRFIYIPSVFITVKELKEIIDGKNFGYLELYCNGDILRNDKNLEYYDIENGDTIIADRRLYG